MKVDPALPIGIDDRRSRSRLDHDREGLKELVAAPDATDQMSGCGAPGGGGAWVRFDVAGELPFGQLADSLWIDDLKLLFHADLGATHPPLLLYS